MAALLVIVEKIQGGEKWSNTHCVVTNNDPLVGVSDADLTLIGANQPINPSTTANGAPGYILQAIAAFDKGWLDPDASITRVYVTDGKRNALQADDYFAVIDTQLGGSARATTAGPNIMPGGVTLQVNRIPVGFSARPGRLFIRGTLLDLDVKLGGPKMIDWTGATERTNFVNLLATILTNSRLSNWFSGGASSVVKYAVPRYFYDRNNPNNPQNGILAGATLVRDMAVVGPALRQVKRGRRRRQT